LLGARILNLFGSDSIVQTNGLIMAYMKILDKIIDTFIPCLLAENHECCNQYDSNSNGDTCHNDDGFFVFHFILSNEIQKIMHTTLIKKKQLEVFTLVILGIVLLAFVISTIVLAVQLRRTKNAPVDCSKCLACATDDQGHQVCCRYPQNPTKPDQSGTAYSCT
jgi:hypothetical protein